MNYNIRMKMKFFVKSVLCLVMLTSLCCSCSDDSESWEELDAPTGEVLPKTDQLSVKLNLPTAVLGNNFTGSRFCSCKPPDKERVNK